MTRFELEFRVRRIAESLVAVEHRLPSARVCVNGAVLHLRQSADTANLSDVDAVMELTRAAQVTGESLRNARGLTPLTPAWVVLEALAAELLEIAEHARMLERIVKAAASEDPPHVRTTARASPADLIGGILRLLRHGR